MSNETLFHVIKDPVHGTMQFSTIENHWLKPFIDSPTFQRLRHIKQLGLGDLIFPGAVHTRFNHCLGCAYIAGQIAHKIGLSEEERQLVMIACLLHDVGHGPFSHAFEDIFHKKYIRHEDWTPFFLKDYKNASFFEEYNRRNPRHHLTEEKFNLIEAMIMHQSAVKPVLADIVSSQLDADRLDYLLRDSHFCGVTYGEFDFRWMLNSMTIIHSPKGERLGLTHKGIGVVEHYLMARRLMTRNIYLNPKKLALEFYLIQLLTALSEDIHEEHIFDPLKKTMLGCFLWEVNRFNHTLSITQNAEKAKKDFLQHHYDTYKELCDYDIFITIKLLAEMKGTHPAIQLAKRLHLRHIPKIIRLDTTHLSSIETLLQAFKQKKREIFQPWQIALIKTPHQSYKIEEDPILIIDDQETVKPLNEISLMIDAISDKFEQTGFLSIDKMIVNHPEIMQLINSLSHPAICPS